MKKYIILLPIITFFTLISLLGYSIYNDSKKIRVTEEELKVFTEWAFYQGYNASHRDLNRDSVVAVMNERHSKFFH